MSGGKLEGLILKFQWDFLDLVPIFGFGENFHSGSILMPLDFIANERVKLKV